MRIVWGALAVACFGLSAFIVYLTLIHPEVPMRGFVIAAVLLGVGFYPGMKARGAAQTSSTRSNTVE